MEALLEEDGGEHHRQVRHQHDQREERRQVRQDGQTRQQRRRVDQQIHRGEREEPAQLGDVGDRPGQQLPRTPAGVERGGQPLHMAEQVGAQRRLQPCRRPDDQQPAGSQQYGLQAPQHREADEGPRQRRHVLVGDGTVHQPLEDQRHGQPGEHRAEGGGAGPGHQPAVRPQIAGTAPQRSGADGRGAHRALPAARSAWA